MEPRRESVRVRLKSMAPDPKPPAPPENGLRISRLRADQVPVRPLIPPPDPRIEEAKTWSETARAAAREAFEAATAGGASREDAIAVGHRAGLRRQLEEKKLSPAGVDLVAHAASLFGARVVGVISARRKTKPLEERCFEMLFPDKGYPEPAREPATPPRRRESGDKDDEATRPKDPRATLTDELARSPRQATLDFGRESRSA
jgi:hypothetical protein